MLRSELEGTPANKRVHTGYLPRARHQLSSINICVGIRADSCRSRREPCLGMVRRDIEALRLPLLQRKLEALGFDQAIQFDCRHAPLIGRLVDDLLSTGEGCRNLQRHSGQQNAELQDANQKVNHDRRRLPAHWCSKISPVCRVSTLHPQQLQHICAYTCIR